MPITLIIPGVLYAEKFLYFMIGYYFEQTKKTKVRLCYLNITKKIIDNQLQFPYHKQDIDDVEHQGDWRGLGRTTNQMIRDLKVVYFHDKLDYYKAIKLFYASRELSSIRKN